MSKKVVKVFGVLIGVALVLVGVDYILKKSDERLKELEDLEDDDFDFDGTEDFVNDEEDV